MAHPSMEKFADSMVQACKDFGVSDYVMVFRDPDSPNDAFRTAGSPLWWIGVGIEMLETGKESSKKCWETTGE